MAASGRWPTNQRRAASALSWVSSVVKLLEQTMKSVLAGWSTIVSWMPSMLETKCVRTAPFRNGCSFHRHDESEIGAADADVDDGP